MTPRLVRRFPNPRRVLRAVLREIRDTLVALAKIAASVLLVFLAGAYVGAFVAGCQTIASLAPGVR